MKYILPLLLFVFIACQNEKKSTITTITESDLGGEMLAKGRCASCHAFPDPKLLDKTTWKTKILPNMARRMGLVIDNYDPYKGFDAYDAMLIDGLGIYPSEVKISRKDWDKIAVYYTENAPDKLSINPKIEISEQSFFEVNSLKNKSIVPNITFSKFNPKDNSIYLGFRNNEIKQFDLKLKLIKNTLVNSTPVSIHFNKDSALTVLCIGGMNPSESNTGDLTQYYQKNQSNHQLTNLKRPVAFEEMDIDNDGINEIFVAEYGYEAGMLTMYSKKEQNWIPTHLSLQAGASKILKHDFNNDGLQDLAVLFAQGDEHISIYYNIKNGQFRENRIINFPPVYGSSDMQLVDFDKDGQMDIVYTNGDNADFSQILKPYHGIRVFLNKKRFFTEKWFQPFNGAFRVQAFDYDLDGDLDIAATSFFPDDAKKPGSNFILLEQTKPFEFKTTTFKTANQGRWMTMDAADVDNDGDTDLLMGSFALSTRMGDIENPQKQKTSFYFLRNKKNN